MTVLDAIRGATRARHEELESRSMIIERLLSWDGRRQVLSALYGLHRQAERVLLPWLGAVDGLHYERRLKLVFLAQDLKALGVSHEAALTCLPPHLANTAEALGFAYVLEGATLGGRIIRKRLSGAGADLKGTSFFDVYGSLAGDKWKSFCSVLELHCLDDPASAVRGACAGFAFMYEGLRPNADTGLQRVTTVPAPG